MTFGEYIGVLASTGYWGKNKAIFGLSLFMAAGPIAEVSEETIKAWISGRRKYSGQKYFPNGSVNEAEFIRYLKSRTRDRDAWKKLQEAFRAQETIDLEATDFRVDLKTEEADVFYQSLLNQFQRIMQLSESDPKSTDTAAPASAILQDDLSSEQIQEQFLEAVRSFKVMDIINRSPAIYNRDDSAELNLFLNQTSPLFLMSNSFYNLDSSLRTLIKSFIEALYIETMSLDATMNRRFGFADKNTSINMEDDEDTKETNGGLKRSAALTISEALEINPNSLHVIRIGVKEWGNFRNEMNLLFNKIESWHAKRTDVTPANKSQVEI